MVDEHAELWVLGELNTFQRNILLYFKDVFELLVVGFNEGRVLGRLEKLEEHLNLVA